MEDNEQNQHLALQVLSLASQGCMLLIPPLAPMLITVGYAEMWLDRDMMFFCEVNGETGKQHILRFARFTPLSNQALFYDEKGELIGTLAPFAEWPQVNTDDMNEIWANWQKDKDAQKYCAEQAREWRHAEL
jgi:hypothetical protein